MKPLIAQLNEKLQQATAETILTTVYEHFGDKIAFASSLGYEDQVLSAMIASHCKELVIFTLDTGRIFPETYDLIEKTNARIDLAVSLSIEIQPDFYRSLGGCPLYFCCPHITCSPPQNPSLP